MADSENHSKINDLPTLFTKRKLLLDDHIEVRSTEDGFQGSWHAAVIIGCEDGWRDVRYENLLQDNEYDFLTERVEVSSSIDGTPAASNKCDRGKIRPKPSFGKLLKQNLHYGLCVDCWYHDAWWEGVVFDYDDGSSKRKIFFPDLGDEICSTVKNLRLTYDWDEVTGEWSSRGNWLFLEIIKESGKDTFITVSLKQIWYDMRGREEFGDIGEWPFPVKHKLEKLIVQVINENSSLTLDAFLKECLSSEAISGVAAATTDLDCLDVDLTKENDATFTTVGELCENVEQATDSQDSAVPTNNQVVPVQPKALAIICSDPKVFDDNMRLLPDYHISKESKSDVKKQLQKRKRKEPESFEYAETECCLQSLYDYDKQERPGNTLTKKVRRHLCYLGYKLDYCNSRRTFRYTSFCGRRFYNLRACVNFEIKEAEKSSLSAEDFQSGKLKVSNTSKKCGKRRKVLFLNIEPKYFPEAVPNYVGSKKDRLLNTKRTALAEEARQHLSAIGWKMWPKEKKGVEEWRYDSPSKRTYYSLMSACRAIVRGEEMHNSSSMEVLHSENPKVLSGKLSSSDKENSGLSFSQKWSRKFKAGKLLRSKQNAFSHSMPSLRKSGGAEQDIDDNGFARQRSIRRLSTSFVSKKMKALDKVRISSDSRNPSRVLRSSKRVREAGASSSSQAPRTVLSWLMDNCVVLGREKVQYCRQGDNKPIAVGRITGYGINCNCCSEVFTLSGFEAHAGSYSNRPAANIYFIRDGKSLAERLLEIMQQKVRSFPREPIESTRGKRKKSWNDHICSVCHYGGELMLCDRCPSSFHAECLGLQGIPEGDWFCPSCCCGICGESYFDLKTKCSTNNSVLSCHQCERKYHAHCITEREMDKLDVHLTENWFCCKMCEKVHWGLQQLLGKPILVGHNNLTWTLIKPMDYLAYEHGDCDVAAMTENYSKLCVALEVMHECFEPVKEPRTRRDLVEDVIFCRGSHLNRLNFKGFYTVLLERNDELITVAILRVYGDKVAEIPLIGTRFKHRRLGMCRIVMQEIEKNLIELGVKRLVLPAAASVLNTWTTAFGFTQVNGSERKELLSYNFLDFQDTVMCQKLLRKFPSPLPHLSRESSVVHHQVNRNIEGNSVVDDPEGNSPRSEVSQEDHIEGALLNDPYEKSNDGANDQDTPMSMVTDPTNRECKPCISLEVNEQKTEHDKSEGHIKFYTRKKAIELRPPVPQANCPKVEVSCR